MIESVIIAAILAPWRKAEWKSFIKKSVITHWVTILRAYAAIKSTLSCIDLHDVNPTLKPATSGLRVDVHQGAEWLSASGQS